MFVGNIGKFFDSVFGVGWRVQLVEKTLIEPLARVDILHYH